METGVKPPYATSVAQMGGRQQGKTAAQVFAEALRSMRESMTSEQAESRLHRYHERYPEIGNVWMDEAGRMNQHTIDVLQHAKRTPVVAIKQLADYHDAEMVMEMIRRGYAVMKLPADGGPPESLRNG